MIYKTEISYQSPNGDRKKATIEIEAENKTDLANQILHIKEYGIWYYALSEPKF